MQTLAELQERRAFECRLTPGRALETLDEAERFLLDRNLLTRTTASGAAKSLRGGPRGAVRAREPGFRAVAGDESFPGSPRRAT